MSEKVLKLLLSELEKVRIVCRKCGSAVEVPIGNLGNAVNALCPGCPTTGKPVLGMPKSGGLAALATAINTLKQEKDVDIEFVVPQKDA